MSVLPAPQIREDVVLAAMKVFSERGYHGASMQDVAHAAGMQKASLYHHVKQKEDLLFAIHDRMIDELTALIIPVVSSSKSPPDKISEIIRVATHFIADHREGATVLLQELGLVKRPRWNPIVAKRDLFIQMVAGVIDEGVTLGFFEETRPKVAARGITGMVNWCYTWFRPDGDLSPDDVAETFSGVALAGLVGRASRGADRLEVAARPTSHDGSDKQGPRPRGATTRDAR